MPDIFDDMERRGAITVMPAWLAKAIEIKHPNLTVALAYSVQLRITALDKIIIYLSSLN